MKMTGAKLIAAERQRQQAIEGYSEKRDEQYHNRELSRAALGYLNHYVARGWTFANELEMPGIVDGPATYRGESVPDSWPWGDEYWKPKDPINDLIRAGALIAAEIDRLQRKANAEPSNV